MSGRSSFNQVSVNNKKVLHHNSTDTCNSEMFSLSRSSRTRLEYIVGDLYFDTLLSAGRTFRAYLNYRLEFTVTVTRHRCITSMAISLSS